MQCLLHPFIFAESEGFEGTDIAYGNPTSKTQQAAGGILSKATVLTTDLTHTRNRQTSVIYLSVIRTL